jgi:hypothetical protein
VSGAFTVVPSNLQRTTYFDPIACTVSSIRVVSNKFTAPKRFTYKSGSNSWQGVVIVPGSGKLIFNHRTLAAGGTPNPLVRSGQVVATKAGPVTMTLKPTAAGAAALAQKGFLKLSLTIEFSPRGGKPANKVIPLTLRR